LVSELGSHSYFIGCITSERDTNKSKITGLMYCRTVEVPGPWPCASLSVGHKSTTQTIRWISLRRLPFDTGISWSRLWLNESVGGTVFLEWNRVLEKLRSSQSRVKMRSDELQNSPQGRKRQNGGPTQFYESKSFIPIWACIILSVRKCSSCIVVHHLKKGMATSTCRGSPHSTRYKNRSTNSRSYQLYNNQKLESTCRY
jgi:hypothetical protein